MAKGKSPGYEKAQNVGALGETDASDCRRVTAEQTAGCERSERRDHFRDLRPDNSEDQMRRERESKSERGREKGNRALAVDFETLAASLFH
jgi:hypothetical protein